MKAATNEAPRDSLPRVSANLLRVFAAYSRGYVHRHFHSLRILKGGLPPPDLTQPLVVFLNHSSWWDPLVCLLLSRHFFANRTSFAPIDESTLKRYSFFKYLGFFGVEQSAIGAVKFLRTADTLLASSRNAIWITPQGRFMDIRERPLRLQTGLGALAARSKNTMFVPLAIEYTFWSEPRPEILVSVGEPIFPGNETLGSSEEWTKRFSDALEDTQDELATRSCRRDSSEWLVLNRGKRGVNSIYDAWRWFRSQISGQKFVRDHRAEISRW